MKKIMIFAAVLFLLGGVFYVNAQQENIPSKNTAIDPDKYVFGINANAGGALGYLYSGGSGAGFNIEFGKGNFNAEINFMFPIRGFGFLLTFNYFKHSRIGGFYLGGGIGYTYLKDNLTYTRTWTGTDTYTYFDPSIGSETTYTNNWTYTNSGSWPSHLNTYGINLGYKFVLSSGVYFRTGIFAALAVDWAAIDWKYHYGYEVNRSGFSFYAKPDLAIGWTKSKR